MGEYMCIFLLLLLLSFRFSSSSAAPATATAFAVQDRRWISCRLSWQQSARCVSAWYMFRQNYQARVNPGEVLPEFTRWMWYSGYFAISCTEHRMCTVRKSNTRPATSIHLFFAFHILWAVCARRWTNTQKYHPSFRPSIQSSIHPSIHWRRYITYEYEKRTTCASMYFFFDRTHIFVRI